MDTFEDARTASEDMFSLPETEVDSVENMGGDGVEQAINGGDAAVDTEIAPEENAVIQEQKAVQVADEAINTAEAVVEETARKENELQQVMARLQQIEQENSQLRNAVAQMSQQQEEAIVNEMQGEQGPTLPELDLSSLAFDDEDVVKQKQTAYAQQMTEYIRNSLMNELAPFLDEAKAGMLAKERAEVYDEFSQIPQLSGIAGMANEVDGIVQNNPVIANADIPLKEKYMLAYAIAEGVKSINTPPKAEPGAEELMSYYEKNPEFRNMIDKKRIEALSKGQQVPQMSASSGASSAALNIKEKPKSFEEASERTRHMFSPRR